MGFADLFKKKPSSGNNAVKRLQFALVADRTGCSPEIMDKIKNDIIEVLSKYVEIDRDNLDINITQTPSENGQGNVPALYANIPIKEVKRH